MIQHIVMWKFREGTEAQAEEFLTRLAALDGQIECIRSMAVRRSAVPGSAYDAVLVSEFDTLEDVARYRTTRVMWPFLRCARRSAPTAAPST